jgi:four helix bundle protein
MKYETDLRNKNRGYMKLIVWQRAMDLFALIWKLTFQETKVDFKLGSQLADATQSISANIAEGYGRRSINEYIHFLHIALGSLAEAMTRTLGLAKTGQIAGEHFKQFDALHYEVENRLLRLIGKLEQKRDAGEWTTRIAEGDDDPDFALLMEHFITPSLHHSTTPSLLRHA